MDDEEYEDNSSDSFKIGIIVFAFSLVLIWFFISSGPRKEPVQYTPPAEPSKEQVKQWTKEYYENGNTDPDIDIDQQYGGK